MAHTIDDLQRNQKVPLLEVWPDGNVPSPCIEEIKIASKIWEKMGRPGPLARECLTLIIAKYCAWDDEANRHMPRGYKWDPLRKKNVLLKRGRPKKEEKSNREPELAHV